MIHGKISSMGKCFFSSSRYAITAAGLAGLTGLLRLLASPARADFYLQRFQLIHEEAGWLKLSPELNFYSASENCRNQGSVDTPPGLTSYSRAQLDVTGAYGIGERVTVFARARWARVDVTSVAVTGTAYGFTDQT